MSGNQKQRIKSNEAFRKEVEAIWTGLPVIHALMEMDILLNLQNPRQDPQDLQDNPLKH